MVEPAYTEALEDAKREREALKDEAVKLAIRIAKLDRTITALSMLCGQSDDSPLGFTDAVRQVVRQAYPAGLFANTVKKMLVDAGFDLTDYTNSAASIHTILKRLVKSGEVKSHRDSKNGKTFYRWIQEEQRAAK